MQSQMLVAEDVAVVDDVLLTEDRHCWKKTNSRLDASFQSHFDLTMQLKKLTSQASS